MKIEKEDFFTQADEKLIVRYLLGDMEEEERISIEDRFFGDDDFYAQMTAIQEELIDDYLRGDLSERDRDLFEKHFLGSPKRRERVEFAAALAKGITLSRALPEPEIEEEKIALREAPVPLWQAALAFARAQRPAFALAVSAAMLAFLFGMIWLTIENGRLGAQLDQARNERGEISKQAREDKNEFERKENEREQEIADLISQRDGLDAELTKEKGRVEELERKAANASLSSNSFVSFALRPGLVYRNGNDPGDEPEMIVIPPKTNSIRLQLELDKEESYPSYRAELRTAGGNLVWSQSMLAARQMSYAQAVFLNIPARVLPVGEYEVTLAGVDFNGNSEVVGYYYFIALKR